MLSVALWYRCERPPSGVPTFGNAFEEGDEYPVSELRNFYSLTPDHVLEAVEHLGHRTTGLCYALNSLENRVYEVELEDAQRVVAKFYRPGRWSRQTLEDEHRLLLACRDNELPVCAPLAFADGSTLHQTSDGIWFCMFPRMGGRSPDELTTDQLQQLGRYLGRLHNVSASLSLTNRPVLSPETYGTQCLDIILDKGELSPGVKQRYRDAVKQLIAVCSEQFSGVDMLPVHGDFHRGNLLHHPSHGWFLLDFDDMVVGPAVQDFWLVLSARPAACPDEVEALIKGYEQFRPFPHSTLHLVEVLRALRYVRYAAWVTQRWDDPAFPRAFPHFGTDNYWESQLADIYEQLRLVVVYGQQASF